MRRIVIWFFCSCLFFSNLDRSLGAPVSDGFDLVQSQVAAKKDSCKEDADGKLCSGGQHFVYWTAIIFDAAYLLMKILLQFSLKTLGPNCEAMATVVWYALTILTLGYAFKPDRAPDFATAVDMATQQITSIGYGSDTAFDAPSRVFHGLNGAVSQIGPGGYLGDLLPAANSPSARLILLMFIGLATWLMFLLDGNKGIDAFYTTLISATTIGYGDIAPSSDWSKYASAFILPALVNAFGLFFSGAGTYEVGYEEVAGDCGAPQDDPNALKEAMDSSVKDMEEKIVRYRKLLRDTYLKENYDRHHEQRDSDSGNLALAYKQGGTLGVLSREQRNSRKKEELLKEIEELQMESEDEIAEEGKKYLGSFTEAIKRVVGKGETFRTKKFKEDKAKADRQKIRDRLTKDAQQGYGGRGWQTGLLKKVKKDQVPADNVTAGMKWVIDYDKIEELVNEQYLADARFRGEAKYIKGLREQAEQWARDKKPGYENLIDKDGEVNRTMMDKFVSESIGKYANSKE